MVYALVNLDVNNFAYVNENYGQEAGDSILQELAALIRSESHVVEACRMYSDYFIELVRGTDKKNILGLVEREDQMFGEQLKIRYPAGAMQLSAGICFIDDGEETFEKILEGANLARKLAKEQNVGAVVYRDDMRKKRDEGIRITGRFTRHCSGASSRYIYSRSSCSARSGSTAPRRLHAGVWNPARFCLPHGLSLPWKI